MAEQLQKGFEVEWCSDVPLNEFGDAELDDAKMHYRDFKTLAEARRFAKKIVGEDWFGSVVVSEFVMVPFEPGYPALDREYIGKDEVIEAD